jgi:hypothetical protein
LIKEYPKITGLLDTEYRFAECVLDRATRAVYVRR